MQVNVRLYATLRRYHPDSGRDVLNMDLDEGTTLGELLDELSIPEDETKMAFVNNRRQDPEHVLEDGDEVGIFPPIAGG